MPDGRTAICVYKYFSLLFIFKLARSQTWYIREAGSLLPEGSLEQSGSLLADDPFGAGAGQNPPPPSQTPSQPQVTEVAKADLDAMYVGSEPPALSLWERFGIAIPGIGLAALLGFGLWSAQGTTSVNFLDVGDCFVQTEAVEVSSLETPDCAEPHDSQIVAIFEADGPSDVPTDTDPFWDGVYDQCATDSELQITRVEELPEDTILSFFVPSDRSWSRGDQEIICYVSSPSGLTGSFVSP